jgi:hypothetical protein
MRHVTVVGANYGLIIGDVIEHIQNLSSRTRPSAYDLQDYYSNMIGASYDAYRDVGILSSNSWANDFSKYIKTIYTKHQTNIMNYVNSKK